jgi:predicted esterase
VDTRFAVDIARAGNTISPVPLGFQVRTHPKRLSVSLFVSVFLSLLSSTLAAAPAYHFQDPTERNVIYGMYHGTALLLDVYLPEKPNGFALVFIMGTGFTAAGEYDDVPLKDLDRSLVEHGVFPPIFGGTGHFFGPELDAGFTVFSINHRLAPAFTWKTQVRDCQRAVQFIRYNAKKYGINPAAIGGMGHSSGATMTTFLAVLGDVADPAAFDPVNRESSRIQAAVAASGVHDLLAFVQERPNESAVAAGLVGRMILFQPSGHPVFAAYRDASTISHVTKDAAPMLIFHGDADPLVDFHQAIALDKALTGAGVPHELVILPGAVHGQLAQPMKPTPGERAATWLLGQLQKCAGR